MKLSDLKLRHLNLRHLALPLLFIASPVAMAATDGTLGATSQGDTDVSITIPDNVLVTIDQGGAAAGDIDLTYVQGAPTITGSTAICIYHRAVATAGLTLSSTNPDAGAFRMTDGSNFLGYQVDLGGAESQSNLTSGAEVAVTADAASSSCGSTFPTTIDVTVQGTDADSVPAGAYSDTITILVEPS